MPILNFLKQFVPAIARLGCMRILRLSEKIMQIKLDKQRREKIKIYPNS